MWRDFFRHFYVNACGAVLALVLCTLVAMWCLSDGARFDRLIFQEGQMLAWPGSVFSTWIMQPVSEEAGEHGWSTVKAQCLGSRWSKGGLALSLSPRQIYPWEVEGYRGGGWRDGIGHDWVSNLCGYETLHDCSLRLRLLSSGLIDNLHLSKSGLLLFEMYEGFSFFLLCTQGSWNIKEKSG